MAVWRCASFELSFKPMPLVMGILNATPDSFSDGGQIHSLDDAIAQALAMVAQGANIIDVGGESTRPNFAPVSAEQELARVIPIVQALAGQGVCVSIDTHKPAVMQAALAAGASIVNDVNALHSPGALEVVLASPCGVVVMDGFSTEGQAAKRAGTSLSMRLKARCQALLTAGVAPQRLMIDPGVGFDKTLEDNLACVQGLPQLCQIAPVLLGASRKSMLGLLTGQAVEHRLAASVAIALLAAQRGAAVLRVHDVQATVDALKVWRAIDTIDN